MDDLEDPSAAGRFVVGTTTETLKRGTDVDSCTSLVRKASSRLEATIALAKREGASVACKGGCSFCCHTRVTVLPHEAIALFRFLKSVIPATQAQSIEQAILSNAARISTMTSQENTATNVPCAFLVEGKCSAYAARPMACAWHHSLDVRKCEYSYDHPEDQSEHIPQLEVIRDISLAMQDGVTRGLEKVGLSHAPLELHTAVAAILGNPGAIARWRAGRPLIKPNL